MPESTPTLRERFQTNTLRVRDRVAVGVAATSLAAGASLVPNAAAALGQTDGFERSSTGTTRVADVPPQQGVLHLLTSEGPAMACLPLLFCSGGGGLFGVRPPWMNPLAGTKGSSKHPGAKGTEKNVGGKHGKKKTEEHGRKAKGSGGRGARSRVPALVCGVNVDCNSRGQIIA